MKQYRLLSRQDSYVIISALSPEYASYLFCGFEIIKEGNKKECIAFLEQHWEDENTPEENRIYLSDGRQA